MAGGGCLGLFQRRHLVSGRKNGGSPTHEEKNKGASPNLKETTNVTYVKNRTGSTIDVRRMMRQALGERVVTIKHDKVEAITLPEDTETYKTFGIVEIKMKTNKEHQEGNQKAQEEPQDVGNQTTKSKSKEEPKQPGRLIIDSDVLQQYWFISIVKEDNMFLVSKNESKERDPQLS